MAIQHLNYSFSKGFENLTIGDARKVKQELFAYLGCKINSVYYRRRSAYRDIPKHIYDGITDIFAKYGLSDNDIWTITQCND